jgi:hypothetical protein
MRMKAPIQRAAAGSIAFRLGAPMRLPTRLTPESAPSSGARMEPTRPATGQPRLKPSSRSIVAWSAAGKG